MDAVTEIEKKAWKLQQRRQAQDAFPISMLCWSRCSGCGCTVENSGCDHTLRFTRAWIAEHQQPEAAILAWLREHGGAATGVLANSADHWEQNR